MAGIDNLISACLRGIEQSAAFVRAMEAYDHKIGFSVYDQHVCE